MAGDTKVQKVSEAANHLDAPHLEARASILYSLAALLPLHAPFFLCWAWVYTLNPKYP